MKPTQIQYDVLEYVIRYRDQFGYPPTTREIQDKFGWASQNSAVKNLKALTAKGYIQCASNIARGIKVLINPFPAAQPQS